MAYCINPLHDLSTSRHVHAFEIGYCAYGRHGAELCVVYQAAVLRVERHVLADSTATIASIQHYLSEYATVLPGVHTVLHDIVSLPNRTDAAVMSLLFDRAQCGKPSLEAVLERLLWNCNQILYRHLSAWYACTSSCRAALTVSQSSVWSVWEPCPRVICPLVNRSIECCWYAVVEGNLYVHASVSCLLHG